MVVVVVTVMMAALTAPIAAVFFVRVRVDNHLAVLSVDLTLEAGGPEARFIVSRPHVLPEINLVMVNVFAKLAVVRKKNNYICPYSLKVN